MKTNNSLNYIHEFLSKEDDFSLVEHILDDIYDSKRLNNGKDKHIVYYLQLSEDEKTGEYNFWVNNIRHYSHLYVYAMLVNWHEQWTEDTTLKNKLDSFLTNFSNEIADEINGCKDTGDIPEVILNEMWFIADYYQWKSKKEVPQFNEKQKQELLSNTSKYERYINLLNSDNPDIITENFIKVLRFCIVIDKTFADTKCLTSFVKCLYGKEDEVNFDSMLKNISLDSSEAETLRKFIKSEGTDIPGDIIKLALYSKISHNIQTNADRTNQNTQNNTAKETLDKSIDDFEILKNNAIHLVYIDQLSLASYIRDTIVNDESISDLCSNNEDALLSRKSILDDIKNYQLTIINKVLSNVNTLNIKSNSVVNDFGKAKNDLYTLVNLERDSYNPINKYTHPLLINDEHFLSHIDCLSKVADNCTNERYTVLLMGEYQSGKTTLMDAIIGKHVGAIGDGNTTSAVPIELSYGKDLKVNVILKKKKELLDLLLYVKKYVKDFVPETFDIDNEENRIELYQQLNVLRRNHDVCPKAKEPGLKVLAICSLVLKYYEDIRLKAIAQNQVNLTHVPMISRFPNRFESRWSKRGGDDFTFEESIFAFVERVRCFLPSETLKQLKCTFVDSPGLFSNSYDTKVTQKEMLNANAILYLLPYEKEAGEDTCSSLYILRNNYPDFLRKLFIVNNRDFSDRKKFYQANLDNIQEMFGSSMNLHVLDARLAYLGVIRKSYENGYLSDDEINDFIQSCQQDDNVVFEGFLDAWDYCIFEYKMRFRWLKVPDSNEVIDKSKLTVVLQNLSEFVEQNKAYSIIVSDGVQKLFNELSFIRRSCILRYIEPHIEGREKTESKWENRLSRASDFEESAKQIIKKHYFEKNDGLSPLSERLAESVFYKVFTNDSIDKLIIAICREIYSNKWGLMKCGKNKNRIENYISPKIKSVISDFIVERVSYWHELLQKGEDQSFSDIYATQVKLMENELDKEWKKVFADDPDFDSARSIYFEVSKDTSKFSIGSSQQSDQGISIGRVSIMGSLLNDIAIIASGIFLILMPTIMSLLFALASNPAGWAIGGVVVTFGALIYVVTGDDIMEKNFVNHYAPVIKEEVAEKRLFDKFKEFIEEEIKKMLNEHEASLLKLRVNYKRMSEDRDIALSSPKEDVERYCFASIKEIENIDEHIAEYSKFCSRYIYAKD